MSDPKAPQPTRPAQPAPVRPPSRPPQQTVPLKRSDDSSSVSKKARQREENHFEGREAEGQENAPGFALGHARFFSNDAPRSCMV